MGLSTTVAINVRANNTKVVDLSTLTDPLNWVGSLALSDGNGSGKADMVYHKIHTVANAGTDVTINIEDGSMNDQFGVAVEIQKLKVLMIYNASADATLEIGGIQGGAELPIFTHTTDKKDALILSAGGIFVWTGGILGLDISGNGEILLTHGGEGADGTDVEIVAIGGSV